MNKVTEYMPMFSDSLIFVKCSRGAHDMLHLNITNLKGIEAFVIFVELYSFVATDFFVYK